jgi:hypothetical protein
MRLFTFAATPARGENCAVPGHHRGTAPRSPATNACEPRSTREYRLGSLASALERAEQMRCFLVAMQHCGYRNPMTIDHEWPTRTDSHRAETPRRRRQRAPCSTRAAESPINSLISFAGEPEGCALPRPRPRSRAPVRRRAPLPPLRSKRGYWYERRPLDHANDLARLAR